MSPRTWGHDPIFVAAYDELEQLASHIIRRERSHASWQPHGLVHEAYLRLVTTADLQVTGHCHLVHLVGRTMRRVLIDHARAIGTRKRGQGWRSIATVDIADATELDPADRWDVERAMARLARARPRQARVVELRIVEGLTMTAIAAELGVTRRTVQNDWQRALRWLAAVILPPSQASRRRTSTTRPRIRTSDGSAGTMGANAGFSA